MIPQPKIIEASPYDEDYYERGVETGVSLYENYRWLADETLAMARAMIDHLPIGADQSVLDYGCAKGYLVKAFRMLGIEAYGCDISEYAIENCDPEVKPYCSHGWPNYPDWVIAKDVFEHIPAWELLPLLRILHGVAGKMFVIVPLAANDTCGKYIVPDYDLDATHVVAKSANWWLRLFIDSGWTVTRRSFDFPGVKERWVKDYPVGNGFFVLNSGPHCGLRES